MADQPKHGKEQARDQVSTSRLDRLERLASTAATSAQAQQWRARKNGLRDEEEASEVRNLSHNVEARAQAEAAMQQLLAKLKGKPRGR